MKARTELTFYLISTLQIQKSNCVRYYEITAMSLQHKSTRIAGFTEVLAFTATVAVIIELA